MTDLEITRACAEAMGWTIRNNRVYEGDAPLYSLEGSIVRSRWQPLHDDAQAMALVKAKRLIVSPTPDGTWYVSADNAVDYMTENADINRAICLCVVKMWRDK